MKNLENYQTMKDKTKNKILSCVHLIPYVEDMPSLLQQCDIVVSRAGASTIAELTALGSAMILIPSPYVASNHQEYNANELVKKQAAIMIKENDLVKMDMKLLCQRNFCQGCTMAISKSVSDEWITCIDANNPHDWEMNIIASSHDGCYFLNKPLIEYRIHDNNTIGLENTIYQGEQYYHYRSMIKELIDFSNQQFYDNKIIFVSKNNRQKNLTPEVVKCDGKEIKGVNNEEIKLIIKKINQYINNANEDEISKILVICFTTAQKDALIEKLNKDNDQTIKRWLNKNNLVIKDITNVQGDEGDIVILSNVFSPESKDFGVLNQSRGQNYLNVAITRAVKNIVIIKSLDHKQLEKMKWLNEGGNDKEAVNYYKSWIKYVDEKIQKAEETDASPEINGISYFKQEIFHTLKTIPTLKQYKISKNINIGSQPIDIAFYKEDLSHIDLVLILDDWKKNLTFNEWFEDIDKQEYLTARGYKVLRIEEINWMQKRDEIIHKIENLLLKNKENSSVSIEPNKKDVKGGKKKG